MSHQEQAYSAPSALVLASQSYHVFGIDPNSMTKPTHVLERWRDKIQIQEWTDDDFLPDNFQQRVQHRLKNNDKDPMLQNHRERQSYFNLQCLRELKRQNRDWTMLIDTDEYLAVNPGSLQKVFEEYGVRKVVDDDIRKTPVANSTSIPNVLESIQIPNYYYDKITSPCIGIHRRQFAAIESSPPTNQNDIDKGRTVPNGFYTAKFQTLRWRRYGYEHHGMYYSTKYNGDECEIYIQRRVPNKVIVDLGRLRLQDLYNINNKGNPHVPLDICSTNVYFDENESPFIVHHYMGTPEQWFYRASDKRGKSLNS